MTAQQTREGWLWKTLASMYPGRWLSSAGEKPTAPWRVGLAALSSEEWREGCRALVQQWTSKHPPSLPEFRALCRPDDGRTGEQRARDRLMRLAEDQHAALPSPEQMAATSPQGRRWMAYWIRQGLRARPPGMTDAMLDEWLDGADLEAMRRQVEHGCNVILQQHGVEQDCRDWRAP